MRGSSLAKQETRSHKKEDTYLNGLKKVLATESKYKPKAELQITKISQPS